jgi:hypothetical protein
MSWVNVVDPLMRSITIANGACRGSTKRVAAAVGEGSAAVRSVQEYLAFNRHI